MIDLKQNIVHRKPRPDAMAGSEWAIVYLPHNKMHPFVVCTITPDTMLHEEWVHGSYYEGYAAAKADFDERPVPETGVEAWKAAGISEGDIELWFDNMIEQIKECAKDYANEEADGMTPDDFREDMALDDPDMMGDTCLLCDQPLDDHDDDKCPEAQNDND